MTVVKFAESMIREASKHNDTSSSNLYLHQNDVKKKVMERFQNDAELYDKCSQAINGLINRYLFYKTTFLCFRYALLNKYNLV